MTVASTGAPVAPSLPFTTRPAQRLQHEFAAVRVSFTWLGVRKTLTPDQKAQAAESFGAEGQYLSAGKKLIDTRHPAYKAVTAIRSKVVSYWRALSLPYPEPGMRLVRQDQIETFNDQLQGFKEELVAAVNELDDRYGELQAAAQQRLGRLFNPLDYPASLQGLFDLQWDFPSVQPPDYLLQLNPALYEQERARMTARFEEAVTLAESAFTEEFSKLVAHLAERLQTEPDGTQKVFRDSAIENLTAFFQRFKSLNVRSNAQLDDLVATAQRAVLGVKPQALRDSESLRRQIATQLATVGSTLDSLMVNRPRRNILRSAIGGRVMQLHIDTAGVVHCVYDETFDLSQLGTLQIRRASHVEPDEHGQWWADMAPVDGCKLGPFTTRSAALEEERRFLEEQLASGNSSQL